MSSNNLRVIYGNVADYATVSSTATAGSLTAANLLKEQKGLVWRSTTTSGTITATWTASQEVAAVILPFCNLTSTATIRVKLYTNAADTVAVLDTGVKSAGASDPQGLWDWGVQQLGANSYSYGGGSIARTWFAKTSCKKLEVIISDVDNTAGYIELSRLVVGDYWSPAYNTNYGITTGYTDTSQQQRTEAGNLMTSNGTVHKSLTFDLSWLTTTERTEMLGILRANGLRKPIFISLFPDDEDIQKEQDYQIYGKLTTMSNINHPMYTIYATSVQIEEI